jgi:hypothetical protein
MNETQRRVYFGQLWPLACKAQKWDRRDELKRKAVTQECMRLIRGPGVNSVTLLNEDAITALFCYLLHLGSPASLDLSARWVDCQQDYKAFNRAHQADWLEGKLYGRGRKNKLQRDRFAGATSAAGEPLDEFDPEAIRKRHLTMATRYRAREMKNVTPLQAQPVENENPF